MINSSQSKKGWIFNKKYSFFQSKLLKDNGFNHAFLTSKSSKSFNEILKNFSSNCIIYKNIQVHSNKVISTLDIKDKKWIKGDAIISEGEGIKCLKLYTADCIPILIGDLLTKQVASCHVGWRGVSNKILLNIVKKFEKNGTNVNNLIFALGPSISKKNYEFSKELSVEIFRSIFTSNLQGLSKNDTMNHMKELKIIDESINEGKCYFDIKKTCILQLNYLGIDCKHISSCKNCTYEDSHLFYSFRRNKDYFRQISFIISS